MAPDNPTDDPTNPTNPEPAMTSNLTDLDLRVSLLELDPLPGAPSDAPSEPAWLVEARERVAAATTRTELNAVGSAYRARSEADRALLRPCYNARHEALAPRNAPTVPVEAPSPTSDATLPGALAEIAAESAANAAIAVPRDMNAVAGYDSAQGYAEAAARAVTQATRDEYLRRAAAGGVVVDPATLPPLLSQPTAPASTTSTGGIITHRFEGPGIFERRRIEMGLAPNARLPKAQRSAVRAAARAEIQAALDSKTLIAGAAADGAMLQVSWIGGGSTTRGKLHAALATIGREGDCPRSPSAIAHAGRAVRSLHSSEYDTARITAGLPEGIAARYLVGQRLTASNGIAAGASYGTALLIVSLTDGGDLLCDGDEDLAREVRRTYASAVESETLKSEDLTAWFGRVLHGTHYAVKRGSVWYVPGGEADAARALSECLETLWGDHERIPVATGPDLVRSLVRGLTDEIEAIRIERSKALEAARDRAHTKAFEEATERAAKQRAPFEPGTAAYHAAQDTACLAAERANVSPVVAARLLADLAKVAARVGGYEIVLGTDATAGPKNSIATLREALLPACDDLSMRAALLELD